MPKRPRQHQLEGESLLAFQRRLPSAWVFRPSIPDYGIDGSVEIFAPDGYGTGRLFLVQLKATDVPELKEALRVSLRKDTFRYYLSLDLPVLIVRYHSPADTLYAKWAHTFDPYYGKHGRHTFTFHFSPDDQWIDSTPDKLGTQLEAWRRVRTPILPLPINFHLAIREPIVHGHSSSAILSEVLKISALVTDLITITTRTDVPAIGEIVIDNEKLEIILGGAHGFTLHTRKGYPKDQVRSGLPYDLLLGIALSLDRAGHIHLAAQLLGRLAIRAPILRHPEIVIMVAGCMAHANRVTEALTLSEALLGTEDGRFAADTLMLPALIRQRSLSTSERDFLRRFFHRRIEVARAAGDSKSVGIAHYNLANHLRAERMNRLAVSHYRQAAVNDPDYLSRPYFARELGGVFFGSHRFRCAVALYRRSVDQGDEQASPLLADALMFSGQYSAALTAFRTYLGSTPHPDSEWILKSYFLEELSKREFFREGQRHSREAVRTVEVALAEAGSALKDRLTQALQQDALCSFAWFNLGVLENQISGEREAFFPYLAAAVINRDDPQAWCATMVTAILVAEYRHLLSQILIAAKFCLGEEFFAEVIKFAERQPEVFPKEHFLKEISRLLSHVQRKEEPFEMRLLGQSGGFEVQPITLRSTKDSEQ